MGRRRILVVAGSDSSGGAGLEADQKVIAAHGCYAMTATTALTAQNTQGVQDIHVTPSAFVQKQIKACIDDIGVDVIKTGMLASADTIKVVAETLQSLEQLPLCVIDPVMVSTSGSQLLPQEAVKTLRELILPLTTILTPNYDEARLLLQDAGVKHAEAEDIDGLKQMASAVQGLGPQYVLLKGGHMPLTKARMTPKLEDDQKHVVVDVLVSPGGNTEVFETEYIDSKQTHGTGCSLASAIASNLASEMSMSKAVKAASQYVSAGIRSAPGLGRGSGPIDHFHSSYKLPFAPGHFVEYLLDRDDVADLWQQHTHHDFVTRLADGTLPMKNFKYYLIQDYLYLVQFARANALAAYKAKDMDDIATSALLVTHIQNEMNLHISYCATFGISFSTLKTTEESQACTAYTRYMLDIGHSEDWLALQISFAPCLLGYGAIARRLKDDPKTKVEGNVYYKWIETYAADDYVEAARRGREMLEKHAVKQSPSRIEELVKIFVHATKMEIGFWEMGSGPITVKAS